MKWWHLAAAAVLLAGLAVWLIWPMFAGTRGAAAVESPRKAPFLEPDPESWQRFLDLAVDGEGRVRYGVARGEGRPHLDAYLDQIAGATPADFESDDRRLAFYINAYNALVIAAILDYWPIDSIEEVGPLHKFFRDRRYAIAGAVVSLHGLESRVIRHYDSRLHFGLNCASASCPPLGQRAFRAEELDRQLEQRTAAFINDQRFNRYDATTNTWLLSKIFHWYADDFGGEAGVRRLLARHANFRWDQSAKLEYQDYDWALNRAEEPVPPTNPDREE